MDALDVRILRLMNVSPYSSAPRDPGLLQPARLARELGTTRDTIKARVARLEETGVILGYTVQPNLRHVGLRVQMRFCRPADDAAKARLLQEAPTRTRILGFHEYLNNGVCVEFAYADDADLTESVAVLERLSQDDTSKCFLTGVTPDPVRSLSRLDWRILHALRPNALRPLSEVADTLGVTHRTVRRRYDRMAREGSFAALPVIDPGRATGLLLFELLFYTDPSNVVRLGNEARRAFADEHVYCYHPADPRMGHVNLLLYAHTPSEVEDLRERGARLPGVRGCEAWLFRRFVNHDAWLDRLLQRLADGRSPDAPVTVQPTAA